MREDGYAVPQPPESSLERVLSDSGVNFDLMDEILSGDCWSETPIPNYSDPLQQYSSFSPLLESNNNGNNQEVEERWVFAMNPTQTGTPLDGNGTPTSETEAMNSNSEQSSNLLVQPWGSIVPVKDRLVHALRFIRESRRGSDVLVQVWVPISRGGRHFLTTCGQPFWLDANSQSLVSYRSVSTSYQFSAEENSTEVVGLPGRVFLGKVPEWTPDVRYFSSSEYLRVDHAHRYNVSGSTAFPVFKRGRQSCLGVVELVMTTQKISYWSEFENVCNALQVCLNLCIFISSLP